MKKTTLVLIILMISLSCFSQSLYWITPVNGHHRINDISFISPESGIAVCNNGVILMYTDGTWTHMQSPTTSNLLAVDMLDATHAVACGNEGVILEFNGSTWTQQVTPDYRQLSDITLIDENNAYAIGGDGILHYNGSAWTDEGIVNNLDCIDFLDATEGWAAGFEQAPVLLHYSNGTWTYDYSLMGNDITFFDDIQIINPQLVRLTGHKLEGDGYIYEYNGVEWQEVGTAPNNGSSFLDETSGYGIGNRIGPWLDEYPGIYKYHNNLWTKEYTGLYHEVFTSVENAGINEAFVSDTEGFVYHGTNSEWNISNGFTADSICDISFTADNKGYFACGLDGIWHYYAGLWTHELKVPGYSFNVIESYDFEVWASAYRESELPSIYDVRIYKFNGNTWELWASPYELFSPVTSMTDLMTYTSANQINYSDGDYHEQTLLLPTDSITSFGPVTIIVKESGRNLEMGYITTKRTEGVTKGAIYSKVFTEDWVLAYETATAKFNDVKAFRFGTEAYAVGDNGLIAYCDGLQWTELPPITSDDLLSVCFDAQYKGWAVGRNGTVLYFNGTAWSVFTSLTNKDLYTVTTPVFPFDGNIVLLGGTNGTLLANAPSIPINSKNIKAPVSHEPVIVYPNPASENINFILSDDHNGTIRYEIFDLSGKRLLSGSIRTAPDNKTRGNLKIRKLPGGAYILKLQSENLIQTGKLVISR